MQHSLEGWTFATYITLSGSFEFADAKSEYKRVVAESCLAKSNTKKDGNVSSSMHKRQRINEYMTALQRTDTRRKDTRLGDTGHGCNRAIVVLVMLLMSRRQMASSHSSDTRSILRRLRTALRDLRWFDNLWLGHRQITRMLSDPLNQPKVQPYYVRFRSAATSSEVSICKKPGR
jgi:hypothetical protein